MVSPSSPLDRGGGFREEPKPTRAIREAFHAPQPHICKGWGLPLQPSIGCACAALGKRPGRQQWDVFTIYPSPVGGRRVANPWPMRLPILCRRSTWLSLFAIYFTALPLLGFNWDISSPMAGNHDSLQGSIENVGFYGFLPDTAHLIATVTSVQLF